MFHNPLPPDLDVRVKEIIKNDPSTMPAMIAAQLECPEASVVMAFPQSMQSFAAPLHFDTVWEDMTGWEKTTFICQTSNTVIEVKGRLPRGKHGHGYFNLMDRDNPLGGHLKINELGSICFLEKPFFGLESLSVQFYDKSGSNMFGVYAGREKRKLIPSVKDGFYKLRRKIQKGE